MGWMDRLLGRQERGLWTRADGDLTVSSEEGAVWRASDQWPGVLQHWTLSGGSELARPDALPVTTRATSLVCDPLTAAPYLVVDEATGERLPTPRWLGDPMLLRGDSRVLDGLQAFPHARRLTRSGFWREVIRSAVWHGTGAFVYQVGSDGSPVAGTLRQVNPATLSVTESARWRMGVGSDTVDFDRDGYLQIGPVTYRIAVMRNPLSPVGPDGMTLGVFGLSPSAFEGAAAVDSYVSGTFRSGVPSGYLSVKNPQATQPQIDELKRKWMDAHGGDRRSIAALSAMVDFTPISWNPTDAQAPLLKRLSISDVAYAFGLPPEVLGVSNANSATYVNVGDAWGRLRSFGLSGWLSELEDLLSSLVPYGRSVRVDFSEFEAETTPDGERPGQPALAPEPESAPDPDQEEEVA